MAELVLACHELRKRFVSKRRTVTALHGVDLSLGEGEVVGLVGPSGAGKTTLARCLAGLASADSGRIEYRGQVLAGKAAWRNVRREIQLIFQNARGSFDPRLTLGESLAEPLKVQGVRPTEVRLARIGELVTRVGLEPEHLQRLPRQLSGGELQRGAIARALLLEPRVLICDEPTTGLDPLIQAHVINVLMALKESHRLSVLYVSHDLELVRHVATRIVCLASGKVATDLGGDDAPETLSRWFRRQGAADQPPSGSL